MSKLFEDAGGSGKRSWMCFVCGKNYSGYDEYKEHIHAEHEEGREYLTCPDCQAPVRDMKAHYKAKHPQRVMPTNLQHKVAIWHDFAPNGGKKKTRKPNFKSGTYFSKKNGGVELNYRSDMEREFYELLENDKDVLNYQVEPFKVPYFHLNEWHDYIPDLRVNLTDGSTQVWEIKPASQTDYEINRAKWSAAHNQALNVGWQFIVQTEVGLGKLRQKIKRQGQPDNCSE